MRRWWVGMIAVMVFCLSCVLVVQDTFADGDAGGWIGEAEPIGGGGGSTPPGSGDSNHCDPSNGASTYLLECTGMSWVFYESQLGKPGGATEPTGVNFVPDVVRMRIKTYTGSDGNQHAVIDSSNHIELARDKHVNIPSECLEHDGGGFWHFGWNAIGIGSGNNGTSYFGGYSFWDEYINEGSVVQSPSNWDANYTYSTLHGAWGHWGTYLFCQYMGTCSDDDYNIVWAKYKNLDNEGRTLEHRIYRNGRIAYKATRSSDLICEGGDCNENRSNVQGGVVWEEFKRAYQAKYPDVDINSEAGMAEMQRVFSGTYAFCYWDGIGNPDYYAKSRIFVNNSTEPSAVADTFEDTSYPASAEVNVYTRPGDINLTFKHNAYSSTEADGVVWRVNDTGLTNNGFVEAGVVDLKNKNGQYYTTDGDNPVNTDNRSQSLDIGFRRYCEKLTVGSGDNISSEVCAKVSTPYNFRNSASAEIGDTVYAGESTGIATSKINVGKKPNNLVGGEEYATRVDDAKVRLVAYLSESNSGDANDGYGNSGSDLCGAVASNTIGSTCVTLDGLDNRVFNSENNQDGVTENNIFSAKKYNVHDAPAGKYYCVALAVYPSTSGSDDNVNADGNGKWYVSAPSCAKILKRPSLRVLGGGIFATGEIDTPASEKKSLNGIYSYTPTSNEKSTAFGSWVEQSAVSYNYITGLASGASTGKTTIGGNEMYGSYEGSNLSYCDNRVPLSFANYGPVSGDLCSAMLNDGKTGKLYEGQGGPVSTDKSALIDFLTDGEVQGEEYEFNNGTNIQLENTSNYHVVKMSNGKLVRVTKGLGDLNISTANSIPRGVTHLVNAAGTVYINSNITYNNDSYSSLEEIPKLIIHGDNIVINCAVEQIDAILVSEHNIKTCTGDDVNDQAHAHRLLINGQLISNTFEPSRTYGAGVGAASGISAETINYDTSTILWARNMVDTEGSSILTPVYRHELPPRF